MSKSPGEYKAGDKKIICPHCGFSEFYQGKAQLNTSTMTLLNLDWANKSATTLACINCGRILWFMKEPEKINN